MPIIRTLYPRVIDGIIRVAPPGRHPRKIVDLKEQIEIEVRHIEWRVANNQEVDSVDFEKVVQMRLQLDNLIMDWKEGKLLE